MTGINPNKIKLPSAFKLAAFESVDSTNDTLRQMAQDGAQTNTVVWAKEQTKGRGRRGRTWVSAPGNFFCSVLQRPNISIADAAKASFVTCLAIHSAIVEVVDQSDVKIECKWPNDVLINGHKVSGILLESQAQPYSKNNQPSLDWLIIGIGINLPHSPDDTPYPSSCINAYRSEELMPEEMLEIFLRHFQIWFERWETLGFAPIRNAWLERAKGFGEQIIVNLETEQLTGLFESLDQDGALVLRTSHSKRLITAGDVFFPKS